MPGWTQLFTLPCRTKAKYAAYRPLDWLGYFIPCVTWLRTYNVRSWLLWDLAAGVAVAAMVVPQASVAWAQAHMQGRVECSFTSTSEAGGAGHFLLQVSRWPAFRFRPVRRLRALLGLCHFWVLPTAGTPAHPIIMSTTYAVASHLRFVLSDLCMCLWQAVGPVAVTSLLLHSSLTTLPLPADVNSLKLSYASKASHNLASEFCSNVHIRSGADCWCWRCRLPQGDI